MTNGITHTTKGKNDECYTQRYAVEPLLEFLEPFKGKIIWCPFDTAESEFVKILTENGYKVVFSHINNGQDFYNYEPAEWDLIVSNPPFTNKRQIFNRALNFNKPFALIMDLRWLNDSGPAEVFENSDLQLLLFKKRMLFKGQDNKINFSCAYFCWNFLPKQIIIRDFKSQKKLF